MWFGLCLLAPLSSFKELKLREDLRLNDLEAVEPVHVPQLEVGRRQLYAAGSRGLLNNKKQSSPSSSSPAVSSPEQEISRELSERRNEEEIVDTWVKECASQVEGGKRRVSGLLIQCMFLIGCATSFDREVYNTSFFSMQLKTLL